MPAEDLPDFFDVLANFDGSEAYRAKFDRFGVSRADPRFWSLYDWFQSRADEANGIHAGVYDLNRYYPNAER